MGVVVVGAGLAGLACARALTDAGVPVRILERGRVVGGRLASRRLDGRPADIGAAYFTVDDPAFAAVVGQALLLLVGPVGCLVLATRRPVRRWTRPARATRPADQGRRTRRTG